MAICSRVSDYYRQQAEECIAAAAATASPRTRRLMLDMAKRWADFADVIDGDVPLEKIGPVTADDTELPC